MSTVFGRRSLAAGRDQTRSIYETIREHEEAHLRADKESPSAPVARLHPGAEAEELDERNLGEHFQDQDIEGLLAEAAESDTTENTTFLDKAGKRPRWMRNAPPQADDDVPESLFIEEGDAYKDGLPEPVPGPATRATRVQWNTAKAQQKLHEPRPRPPLSASTYFSASSKDKALWRWANVENLDNFLSDVYEYYVQKGIWSITLARLLSAAQLAFIVVTAIFLFYCIDYSRLPLSKSLSQVTIPKCTKRMSFLPSLVLWLFVGRWFLNIVDALLDLRRLRNLHDFYLHLLDIDENELQTISWQEVVGRLMNLRDANPRTATRVSTRAARFVGSNSKDRMDAHDIANRIMRKDNYLIAMFNKEILDMSLPLPFLKNRQLYSKNLEWNINQAILGFFFNDSGQVYQFFLKDTDRKSQIEALRRRFMFYGFMNVLSAPFLIAYYLTAYFFRYFKEFQSNPSQIGSRAYTPMAEWKFREFNELYHFFRRRADMSFPFASRYLDQFPKDKTVQLSSFVAFVSGALLALLAVASLLDPSNFFNFEISADRTVLFYLGVLTVIWTVSRSVVPEENEVFDPEFAIQEVINYTHYCPSHWKSRLHSDEVRREFSSFYQMRILIFLEEIMSIMFTPLVLWFSLPKCSDRIVDFMREFTVHVDGLGYVCSFALFEFKRSDNAGAPDEGLREDYYASKDNKMLASYYSFIDNYGSTSKRARGKRFQSPPAFPGMAPYSTASITKKETVRPTDPSPSLLLDPHHQPPVGLARRLQQSSFVSGRRASVLHEAPEASPPRAPHMPHPLSTTTMLDEDSRLGDSWKISGAAAVEDDDTLGQGDDRAGGVLGMIYQFQKAQTPGRGGPVT